MTGDQNKYIHLIDDKIPKNRILKLLNPSTEMKQS